MPILKNKFAKLLHNGKQYRRVYKGDNIIVDFLVDESYFSKASEFVFDLTLGTSNTIILYDRWPASELTEVEAITSNFVKSSPYLTDWGDGNQDHLLTHTYKESGIYTVKTYYHINNILDGNIVSDENTLTCLTNANKLVNIMHTNLNYLYNNCLSLKTVDGLNDINIENLNDVSYMFNNCTSLISLDLSSWNTSNVTNSKDMFFEVPEISVLGWNYDETNYAKWNLTEDDTSYSGTFPWNLITIAKFTYDKTTTPNDVIPKISGQYFSRTYDANASRTYIGTLNSLPANISYEFIDGEFSRNGTDSTVATSLPFSYTYKGVTIEIESNGDFYLTSSSFFRIHGPGSEVKITIETEGNPIGTNIDKDNGDGTITRIIGIKKSETAPSSYNFSDFTGLISLEYLDTSNVTDMSSMFAECSSLTSLNLSNFDTSKVTSMACMFLKCSSLTSLDLSNFDTSKVTDMTYMFNECSSLTSLDLSNFDTSKVTSMVCMFQYCSSLTSLDVSSFNTSEVTDMQGMFFECSKLTSLDLSNFNTSEVTNMAGMFWNCSSLISLDLSKFNTSKVTSMWCMFQDCSSLTSLDLSKFNTSNVTEMYCMFLKCSSLTSLDLSSFNTSNVTDMGYMFTSVPATIDWHYDGSNYANWTLTEEKTGYSGTFPWNQNTQYSVVAKFSSTNFSDEAFLVGDPIKSFSGTGGAGKKGYLGTIDKDAYILINTTYSIFSGGPITSNTSYNLGTEGDLYRVVNGSSYIYGVEPGEISATVYEVDRVGYDEVISDNTITRSYHLNSSSTCPSIICVKCPTLVELDLTNWVHSDLSKYCSYTSNSELEKLTVNDTITTDAMGSTLSSLPNRKGKTSGCIVLPRSLYSSLDSYYINLAVNKNWTFSTF